MSAGRGIVTTREVIPQWTAHLIPAGDVQGVNVDLKDDQGAPIPYEYLGFALPNGDALLFVLPEPVKATLLRELSGGIEVPAPADVAGVVRQLEQQRKRSGQTHAR